MSIEDYYTQEIITQRTTTSKSTMGSTADSWATNLTILGRIRPKKGIEIIYNEKREIISDYTLYCAPGLDILERDRTTNSGNTYTVIFVKDPMSMNHHLEIHLKLIV